MTQKAEAKTATQDTTQAVAQPAPDTTVESYRVHYPAWPTSKPGPRTTPPPAGTKPINAIRREQVTPVIYDQETGEPVLPEETKVTGEQRLGKRKQRL
ncbi:hypothetical protein KSF_037510 [Reticulibacter mediterranei]|uniref:Uncharacterized protein n=1 Tax=Reticulibacter mediterranei TaxID=2778369 RepID=A0A8J3IJP3_9CHLR|nr:hypothetical protein [Reticulibacter mediterranei]GHO93703.1 hypothetical protein KSF_037510 [Reticulibacter mediterranei]